MELDKESYKLENIFDENSVLNQEAVSIVGVLKRFPKTIKGNVIPIVVMLILWMLPALLSQFGKEWGALKPLNFLTAARSGIVNPSTMELVGGIAAKSVVLTFLIGVIMPVFKGYGISKWLRINGYISGLTDLLKQGLKGMGSLLMGIGVALAIHGFVSTDFTTENSFPSLILSFFSLGVASKFKKPSVNGLLPGFLAGFVMSFWKINTYLLGGGVLVLGVVLYLVGTFSGKSKAQVTSIVMLLVIPIGLLSSLAFAIDPNYNENNPGVELILPTAIMTYEPFEVVIKISNPDVKKQVDRIQVNTGTLNCSIVGGPAEDSEGKNYNGEDEVRFWVTVNDYVREPRKLDFNVHFIQFFMSESGTRGEGGNLWLSTGLTQFTQRVEIGLPSRFTYKNEYPDPYTNAMNYLYTENVKYEKSDQVNFSRWFEVQMFNTSGDYFLQEGIDNFDMIQYGLEALPDNPNMPTPITSEMPKELLDYFGASKGAIVKLEQLIVTPKANSTELLSEIFELDYYFFYLKGNTIFEIWGEAKDGYFEARAGDLMEEYKGLLYDAMASVKLVPIPSDAPVYPVEVKAYFFPEDESVTPIVTENTIIAEGEAVEVPAETPYGKGAVAIALAGGIFATAVGGAVASGLTGSGAEESSKKDNRKREYQLIISKTVKRNIKSDQNVTLYAHIFERIYEADGTYSEQINRSLTEQIAFSSPEAFVKLSDPSMSGDNRVVAFMATSDEKGKRIAHECTLTCTVSGQGGVHKQNIIFTIVDEPYVAIDQKLFVLAGSGKSYDWTYEPKDFVEPVTSVEITCHQSDKPFEIKVEKELKDRRVTVKDLGIKKDFEGFFDSFTCEIVAKNNKEIGRTVFYVVLCHEGIMADFLGNPSEIHAKLKDDDSGDMVETRIKVRAGVWDDKQRQLQMVAPEDITITFEDEKGIFGLLEATATEDPDFHTPDGKSYRLSVAHSLPSMNTVNGKLTVNGNVEGRALSGVTAVLLEPDKLTYEKAFEKEYQNCKRIIEVYMAERFKSKKLQELERAKHTLGLGDLKVFRQNCWGIAERCIMQERQQYVMDEAWYDEAIATAEVLVYIGDIAFDLALGPIGGPIAGFVAAQVKASFLEVVEIIVEHPDKPYFDIIWDFVSSRIEQTMGSADGLIEVPKASEQKKLAIWLTCYVIYRIGIHWWYDKDEDDQPIGLVESVKAALQDFVGKGFGVLLGDFIGKSGKGRWPEKISVTDADQDLVNAQVAKAAKSGFDALDKAAAKADDAALALYRNLMAYFKTLSS